MKTAWIFFIAAGLFLAFFLYFLDLILFYSREKKRFENAADEWGYVTLLEGKQKKAKHPKKRNYYLYLICLAWMRAGEKEKANRLIPFLKKDTLLGISENPLGKKTE